MSIRRRADGKYQVRYREGGRHRARTFDRKSDARDFDDEVRRRRQRGALGPVDAGSVTLEEFFVNEWVPTFAPLLADRTATEYAGAYDRHIGPALGGLALHAITPPVLYRWQVALGQGHGVEKVRCVLSTVLREAVAAGYISANPVHSVRAPRAPLKEEVRPLAPASVEALRASLGSRDATLVSLLAYAGLRPAEACTLLWGHVLDKTLVVNAGKTGRRRSVRLLAPLRADLLEWRLACSAATSPDAPVIPRPSDGGVMSPRSFNEWRGSTYRGALADAGLDYAKPYALRHSFASLLLHEGRSVVYIADQMGNTPAIALRVYAHVMAELDGQEKVPAEELVRQARRARAA